MNRLVIFALFFATAAGCATDPDDEFAYEPGPDRAAISSKEDAATLYRATYTCSGGTGDVSVSVEKKTKAVYIQNTEAGARYVAHSKTSTLYKMAVDESDPYTDSDLMGDAATVSLGAFTSAKTIKVVLESGESGGDYTCTIDK